MRVTPDMEILGTIAIHEYPEVGREPDVCFGAGNHFVVWSQGEFGSESHVRASRVSPEGAVLDTGNVCGMDHYCEYHPAIAYDGERFLVVWYNYVELPAGVYGRFLGPDCLPDGREFRIRDLPVNTINDPDIAFLDSLYLIVWNEPSPLYDDDIYGQIVDMNGTLIGGAIPIAVDTSYQYQSAVCAADTMFLAVWYQNSEVYGRFIGRDGSLPDSSFPISDPPVRPRDLPDIAWGAVRPLAVWHEFVDDDHEIYGDMEFLPYVNEDISTPKGRSAALPTIVAGKMVLPGDADYRIYDALGRQVHDLNLQPGIYFVVVDNRITAKVVKIR